MEQDEYLEYKTREQLALAFINKLENVDKDDMSLIPALIQWIKDGDNDHFKEFKEYHSMDYKQKKSMLEDALAEQKAINEKIAEVTQDMEKAKEAYELYYQQMQDWHEDIYSRIKGTQVTSNLTLKNFKEKIEDAISSGVSQQTSLWVRVGDKLCSIKNIIIQEQETGKFNPVRRSILVGDVEVNNIAIPPLPPEYNYIQAYCKKTSNWDDTHILNNAWN